MKIRYLYSALLTLLLACNVFGGSVFSNNSQVLDLDPRNYDYLQEDQNTTAHLFEEISIGCSFQIVTKNDVLHGNDLISGNHFTNRGYLFHNNLTSLLIQDKKEILKTFIFPFHFFW